MTKIRDNTIKILLGLCVLTVCFKFTLMFYYVHGESMMPRVEENTWGLAVRLPLEKIERFDIVIIKNNDKYIIKRAIGLPGEHIQYKNNQLSINNQVIVDSYAVGNTEDFEYILGENEYFCLGDNREHSSDSRYYGSFNIKNIKAVSIYNKGIELEN